MSAEKFTSCELETTIRNLDSYLMLIGNQLKQKHMTRARELIIELRDIIAPDCSVPLVGPLSALEQHLEDYQITSDWLTRYFWLSDIVRSMLASFI
ncbi:MAG: hypothetical protein KW806_01670 [Candidatus Yanofskybacteria bacterium]|nr:hypothetical protein [Candidatus Yanofskybacteria bacterium]